ncbi:MAG: hypothetical protein DME18_09645 [Verrucomicrobia bacterium]|nr:MAG: hypothetical protein DME18_09645 [Verrucomicrobiota bacterium]
MSRESAGGIVAPLNAARTAQRAVPTRFRVRASVAFLFRPFRRGPRRFFGARNLFRFNAR